MFVNVQFLNKKRKRGAQARCFLIFGLIYAGAPLLELPSQPIKSRLFLSFQFLSPHSLPISTNCVKFNNFFYLEKIYRVSLFYKNTIEKNLVEKKEKRKMGNKTDWD